MLPEKGKLLKLNYPPRRMGKAMEGFDEMGEFLPQREGHRPGLDSDGLFQQ
jgi:hypothetical protein